MKKNPFIKVMTIIILIIAAISLVFGSAIMLLWWNTTEENNQTVEYIETEINAEIDTGVEINNEEWEIESGNNSSEAIESDEVDIAEIE